VAQRLILLIQAAVYARAIYNFPRESMDGLEQIFALEYTLCGTF
jgi:hypothetical protein